MDFIEKSNQPAKPALIKYALVLHSPTKLAVLFSVVNDVKKENLLNLLLKGHYSVLLLFRYLFVISFISIVTIEISNKMI